jgi:predicted RNA binding protein YcfA (HicA-like mRNA interferase family)
MNKRKLLARLMENQKNVKYSDFITLLKSFGFKHDRTGGSHSIFKNDAIPERVNIQNKNGEAKPYQVNQFLGLIEKYDLKLDGEEEEI